MRAMRVILHQLTGNRETVEALNAAVGKTIASLQLVNNELRILFDDGSGIRLFDDGQSCCEERWMHTDDDLSVYVGARLIDAEVRDGPGAEGEESDTESQFLVVTTSAGAFTMVNYNSHNGYYGGFIVIVRPLAEAAD